MTQKGSIMTFVFIAVVTILALGIGVGTRYIIEKTQEQSHEQPQQTQTGLSEEKSQKSLEIPFVPGVEIELPKSSSLTSPPPLPPAPKNEVTKEYVPEVVTQPIEKFEAGGIVLILVDETVLPSLKEELVNYTGDIKRELGLDTLIKSVSSTDDVHSLKSYVLDFFKKENLIGVLLIGNIPTGYFYHPDVQTGVFTSEGLILGDFIYQDILNACDFSPEHNAFSYKNTECQTTATIQPYWVARLTPNSSDHSDIELLKNYFKRNHEYRNGLFSFEQKALIYQPVILDFKGNEQQTAIDNIKQDLNKFETYPSGKYNFIDIFSSQSDNDYLSNLSRGYETLIFNGHGTPLFHQKNITSKSQIDAKFFFGNFLSCSVGRFTTKDYIAGKYLFGGGLVSLAPSTPVFASSGFDA